MNFIYNKKDVESLKIESMTLFHIDEIINLQEECNLSYWSRVDYKKHVEDGETINLVAILDKITVGFIISRPIIADKTDPINSKKNELEIYNICVQKNLAGKGIGKVLLKNLFEKCKSRSVGTIWLEVRETNFKAVSFYKNHGFKESYKRKNYYQNPPANALVMHLDLADVPGQVRLDSTNNSKLTLVSKTET